MSKKYLICSDLDRTIIPNGAAPESPEARPLLRELSEHSEVTLAYVSGRNEELLHAAIREYDLPRPDYAVGDVGTTIYACSQDPWTPLSDWERQIAADWPTDSRSAIAKIVADFPELKLQAKENQNSFKLSYHAPVDFGSSRSLAELEDRIDEINPNAISIWSVDEAGEIGLLDIVPHRATKYHAVKFLMQKTAIGLAETVFAGDSGNDLPIVTSELQSVLVANARDEIKDKALADLAAKGAENSLYIATGGFRYMNGNYAAGVLEGVAHFLPALLPG